MLLVCSARYTIAAASSGSIAIFTTRLATANRRSLWALRVKLCWIRAAILQGQHYSTMAYPVRS